MIDEKYLAFPDNETYYNNTASLLNKNGLDGVNASYSKTYSVTWLDVGISWSFLLAPGTS